MKEWISDFTAGFGRPFKYVLGWTREIIKKPRFNSCILWELCGVISCKYTIGISRLAKRFGQSYSPGIVVNYAVDTWSECFDSSLFTFLIHTFPIVGGRFKSYLVILAEIRLAPPVMYRPKLLQHYDSEFPSPTSITPGYTDVFYQYSSQGHKWSESIWLFFRINYPGKSRQLELM